MVMRPRIAVLLVHQGQLLHPVVEHHLLGLVDGHAGGPGGQPRARGHELARPGGRPPPVEGMSRCERIPARRPLPFVSSMRMPLALWVRMNRRACGHGRGRGQHHGLLDHVGVPRLHVRGRAPPARRWSELRCRKPRPPSRARVFAISSPTTVSMFAPTTGRARARPGTSGMVRSTWRRVATGCAAAGTGSRRRCGRGTGARCAAWIDCFTILAGTASGRRLEGLGASAGFSGGRRGASASTSPRDRAAAPSRGRAALLPVEVRREPLVPGPRRAASWAGWNNSSPERPGIARSVGHDPHRRHHPSSEGDRDQVVVEDGLGMAVHPAQVLALLAPAAARHGLEGRRRRRSPRRPCCAAGAGHRAPPPA